MSEKLFPRLSPPIIYAYSDYQFPGCLKVGFTARTIEERMDEHYPTKLPNQTYKVEWIEYAIREDGTFFKDHAVHRILKKRKVEKVIHLAGEWFKCDLSEVKSAIYEVKTGNRLENNRTNNFGLRPEQQAAIDKTSAYFESFRRENPSLTPHFLWNAKMRFGKTFTAYQLAKKMGWKRVLVVTFKPAVQSAWEDDLINHVDFSGWKFVKRMTIDQTDFETESPLVCFGSFQDLLGENSAGGIKPHNINIYKTTWDCVIFDEYHFGAWRENAQDLFNSDSDAEMENKLNQKLEDYGIPEEDKVGYFENNMQINTRHYLYLSGTPFRAISTGEFIEEQIFNWTYSDEQKAKRDWVGDNNPYASLPRMMLLTYQMPDDIKDVASRGEFNEFDLNVFFSATGEGVLASFVFENEVQKWLDLIRGSFSGSTIDNLRLGDEKPPMPFSHTRLLQALNHTLWYLPNVAACYAMANLLKQKQNVFYQDYQVLVCAGTEAGIGVDALRPVQEAMLNPLESKTITLTCGKLTTGVSVPPWTGIFILRNSSSPETYFQAAFRVQTPWVLRNYDPNHPDREQIIKEVCYVFDFAPNRALRLIADYSCQLNMNETNPEKKVEEFISFLPVLAFDGSQMMLIDAAGVLDMAMSGTTSTLLARRWESALLVNVDNNTLHRLMNNQEAMQALMNIEGFRNLNQDIQTIINKSESVKKAKNEANNRDLTAQEKRQMTQEEKEFKTLRKQIQDKLKKLSTRIPIFMYLTDFREYRLEDVITKLEPVLFRRVTGLTQPDFELLVGLGVFNKALMNDAVFKFKRYEDASLEYTGINRHKGMQVGGYDTVLSSDEYSRL